MKKIIPTLLLLTLFNWVFEAKSQVNMNSFPAATPTIYLDFDGEKVDCMLWNAAVPFNCAPALISKKQVLEIYNRVAEDFRPFNINITTDEAVFLAAPLNKRIRVIITPTSSWFAGVGGIAYIGSFNWGDDTPCFVFSDRLGNDLKMISECCSHETGHTLGLAHQSKYDESCALTATYNDGKGTGEVSWAPIMGNSYHRNMSGWNNGPTPHGCSNTQDNLSIITTKNGFSYKTDDFSNDINSNPTILQPFGLDLSGLISTNNDKDAFQFTLPQNQHFKLSITPFSIGNNNEGANLDAKISVFDENKILVGTYNPSDRMDVSIDTILNEGTYYFVVEGAGNSNVSSYGSLGSYKITSLAEVLFTCKASLIGTNENKKHQLGWDIQCSESVKNVVIESSENGTAFKKLQHVNSSISNYIHQPLNNVNTYYRIKVVTLSNRTTYSNIILLKNTDKKVSLFQVGTFTQHEISVQASTAFQYVLTDINGNGIKKGIGAEGLNKIAIAQKAAGTYILQLFARGKKETFRIVKQ